MGGLLTKKVGDRMAEQEQAHDAQLATMAGGQYDQGHYPTATAVSEDQGNTSYVTAERTWMGGNAEEGLPTSNAYENQYQNTSSNDGEDCVEQAKGWFYTLIFIGAFVGISVAASLEEEPSAGGIPPANVVVCPTVFDAVNQSVVLSACARDGCGGSIEWCGLNDAGSYRLIVSASGDYDSLAETVTLNVSGTSSVVSPSVQCGSTLEQILDQVVVSTAGVLLLTYQNSENVDNLCTDPDVATFLNATLIEL